LNPLFTERQRRRLNPVIDVAPEQERRAELFNQALTEKLGEKADETARFVQGPVNVYAGRDDPLEVGMGMAGMVAGPGMLTAPMRSGAGMFGGKLSATADLDQLARAIVRTEDKGDRDDILGETGWFQDKDKKWRYEISDDKARLKPDAPDALDMGMHTDLEAVLDHPEFFKAYPHLRRLKVHNKPTEGALGTNFGDSIGLRMDRPGDEVLSTLLHEIQHSIQNTEGFAKGGSPRMFSNDPNPRSGYNRLLGEIEARDVQSRQRMTPEDRRAAGPWWERGSEYEDPIIIEDLAEWWRAKQQGGLGGLGGRAPRT
jgi:hypothetical protein